MSDESLYDFVSSVAGDRYLRVEQDLGDGFVRLKVGEAERRQARDDIRCVEDAVIELLRNARDAGATHIYLASSREGQMRTITVIDDASGVPERMRELIFEPRVTSKLETMSEDAWGVHGRGMALYSIRTNAEQAKLAATGSGLGSSFSVTFDLEKVPEKADQATAPQVERTDEGGYHVVRGPHNVLRQAVEFSLESPHLDLYLGSPNEILATLLERCRAESDPKTLKGCKDPAALPLWQRPGAARDVGELIRYAASIGLAISERSAHRIASGRVRPLRPVLSRMVHSRSSKVPDGASGGIDLLRDRRGLSIASEDLADFKQALAQAFSIIGERYYVTLADEPAVTVAGDKIRVRFDFEKEL